MAKPRKKEPFDVQVFLNTVAGGRTVSNYRKNQKVFSQGDPGDAVFYIQSGKVKKTVVSEQGKEAVVALLGAGDFFGEGCLAGQPLRISRMGEGGNTLPAHTPRSGPKPPSLASGT